MLPNGIRAFAGLLALAAGTAFAAEPPKAKPNPPAKLLDETAVRAVLDREIDAEIDGQSVKDVCKHLADRYGLAVRIDTTALKRFRPDAAEDMATAELPAEAAKSTANLVKFRGIVEDVDAAGKPNPDPQPTSRGGRRVDMTFPLKDQRLRDVLDKLERDYEAAGKAAGVKVRFVVRADLLAPREKPEKVAERKFTSDVNYSGLTLGTFLDFTLLDVNATFIVRQEYIEITTNRARIEEKVTRGFEAIAATATPGTRESELRALYDAKLVVPVSRGMTVADTLAEMCAQMPGKWAYRVRHNVVLIAPAFQPMTIPGARGGDSPPFVPAVVIAEQLFGETVNFQADAVPLADALRDLRKRTGANVVLDPRAAEAAKAQVSGAFNDARLLTVLQTLADMAGLKVVSRNNVFYVTSPANAAAIQDEVNRELFGTPAPAAPRSGLPPADPTIPPPGLPS